MRNPIRVLIFGTGQMGSAIARLVLRKPGFELVAAVARRPQRAGMDVGAAIGLGRRLGFPVVCDAEAALARTRPQIAIQTTCSRLVEAVGEITTLIDGGASVISIAEEMAFPVASSPSLARQIHTLALDKGVGVLGTGINPGFICDLLAVALSGVCAAVTSITCTRVNDLSPYGDTVLRSQGVGLSPEAFARGVNDGSVSGHIGFPQSIGMIASTLGWNIERVEEAREAIVARVRRVTPRVAVEPGRVAGCLHTAVAYRAGARVITLVHPQQVAPESEGVTTGDRIEIRGNPDLCFSGTPEIPGGQATAALAVNMIPRLLSAPPGLHTMTSLPVPAALMGDGRGPSGRQWEIPDRG